MNTAPAKALPNQIDKVIGTMRASPAKSSALTGLVLIMVIAWMRVLLGGRTSPPSAQAAPAQTAATANLAPAQLPVQHRVAESAVTIQQWSHQPAQPLTRNPFAVPMDFYPADGSKGGESGSAVNGYWTLVAKSMSSRADQQQQRQILVDNIRLAAGSLKLESTIMGTSPGAMVNGELVRVGSLVAGFRVLKIEPRELVIEREGVKLAIEMD